MVSVAAPVLALHAEGSGSDFVCSGTRGFMTVTNHTKKVFDTYGAAQASFDGNGNTEEGC